MDFNQNETPPRTEIVFSLVMATYNRKKEVEDFIVSLLKHGDAPVGIATSAALLLGEERLVRCVAREKLLIGESCHRASALGCGFVGFHNGYANWMVSPALR